VITPQPQESGYWTKVLANTFGLANRKRRLFLRGRPGLLRLHQPKVCLVCSAANTGVCESIGQYHRLIDSSPPFWLNQKCAERRRRNWIAFSPGTNMDAFAPVLRRGAGVAVVRYVND
jgi:predicted nicotinamide N-methyase